MNLLKLLYTDLFYYWSGRYRLAAMQAANPTCRFYRGAQITNSTFGNYSVVFANTIVINSKVGSHSYIQKNAAILNAEIGKFCSIAASVTIAPGIHNMEGVSTHPAFYLKNTPLVKTFVAADTITSGKTVKIGHDVWIGQNAVIIDGVTVGTGAIIAAGAIVTKDVAPYTIVGGIPAKPIRLRFEEEVCNCLYASEWWNREDAWLEQHAPLFPDPLAFLAKLQPIKP